LLQDFWIKSQPALAKVRLLLVLSMLIACVATTDLSKFAFEDSQDEGSLPFSDSHCANYCIVCCDQWNYLFHACFPSDEKLMSIERFEQERRLARRRRTQRKDKGGSVKHKVCSD
jgi:hypothetical protein